MLTLHPIPAFSDNYIWCLHNDRSAIIIDPGQAEPVLDYLNQQNLILTEILITHHHWDHVSGIETLCARYPSVPVLGPSQETIPAMSHPLVAGDEVYLEALDCRFNTLEVPGHTLGHIAFYAEHTELGPLLFCGDTLFSSGCGRLFEGTAEQLFHSLQQYCPLPDHTLVCCTHEYTLANLAFAQAVEPDNMDIKTRLNEVSSLRSRGLPSLPSRIGLEKRVNPFLRTAENPVIEQITQHFGKKPGCEAETFAKLRQWKDQF